MTLAYIGLGSNLGDRESLIQRSAELIGAKLLSEVRETEPWGYVKQPRFLNGVAEIETELSPRRLLDLHDLQAQLGASASGRSGDTHDRPRPAALRRRAVDEPGSSHPIRACSSANSCSSRSPISCRG
jgi:2-amino-4-hydroxy-6-hydroxymethyldihydropteridine diphosphokinase